MKYLIYISAFLVGCSHKSDNSTEFETKSITEKGIKINVDIPNNLSYESYSYCDGVLNMVYSFSSNKIPYDCPEKWPAKEEIASIGDQILIYVDDNIDFGNDYFNEIDLNYRIERQMIANPSTKFIQNEICKVNGEKAYCFKLQYEFADRVCFEVSQNIIKNGKLVVITYYGFDKKDKLMTAKTVFESVKFK